MLVGLLPFNLTITMRPKYNIPNKMLMLSNTEYAQYTIQLKDRQTDGPGAKNKSLTLTAGDYSRKNNDKNLKRILSLCVCKQIKSLM